MATDRGPLSDADFERQLRAARKRAERVHEPEPRAVFARYDHETGRITVDLSNGCTLAFPAELAEGLRGAEPGFLEEVEVSSAGLDLHWERLDVDHLVGGLLRGVFGTRRWMRELGRLGGQAKSERKARAARKNGLKGGRPRKLTP